MDQYWQLNVRFPPIPAIGVVSASDPKQTLTFSTADAPYMGLPIAAGQAMSGLTKEQVAELQRRYEHLVNYERDDPTVPIDPLTYRAADGDHLIHIAAFTGDLTTVEWLLDAGEDVNAVGDMGETPAHNAASNLHKDVFELLAGRGADLTTKSEFGMTPIETWTSTEKEKRWACTKPRWLR